MKLQYVLAVILAVACFGSAILRAQNVKPQAAYHQINDLKSDTQMQD